MKPCIICNREPEIFRCLSKSVTQVPRIFYRITCKCGLRVDGITMGGAINDWNELEMDDVIEIRR